MITGQWRATRYCTRILNVVYQHVNRNILGWQLFQSRGSYQIVGACERQTNGGGRDNRRISSHAFPFSPTNPTRPLDVQQPVFFMSSKTMLPFLCCRHLCPANCHYFLPKGIIGFFNLIVEHFSWRIELCLLRLLRHHNSPEKILIHRLCVSLLTRDGFLVISAGFLEVPVGLCTHIG